MRPRRRAGKRDLTHHQLLEAISETTSVLAVGQKPPDPPPTSGGSRAISPVRAALSPRISETLKLRPCSLQATSFAPMPYFPLLCRKISEC